MNLNKKQMRKIMELIVFAGVVLWCVFNYSLFIKLIKLIITLVTPLLVGIGFAFFINVPMKKIEKNIFKIEKRKHKGLIRGISLFLSILIIFSIIALILFLVIPEIIEAIGQIGTSIPYHLNWINNLIDKTDSIYPNLSSYIRGIDTKGIVLSQLGNTNNIVTKIIIFLTSMVSKLFTCFIGFIISIYILIDKENLARQTKKLLLAFLPDKSVNKIVRVVELTNNTFEKFLTGQCLDACLTGFELFLVLTIIRAPYALIIGVLFAVMALIPYIGGFITLVVGLILIGVTKPMYALWYLIAYICVQQFDDNFTYPKIVGGSVGLPALWALVAVLAGGSLAGFIGMIVSIPISSVLYTLLKEFVNKKIEEKRLS